jgi:hypothetical protein
VAGDVTFFSIMRMKLAKQLRSGPELLGTESLISNDHDMIFGEDSL